ENEQEDAQRVLSPHENSVFWPRPCLWRLRLKLYSKNFSLLFEFFPARFKHLVVSRFLETVDHAMLAYRFLFLRAGTRQSVALGAGHYTPFLRKIGIVRGLFRRCIIFRSHQFVASLSPVSFGKFVRVALINHRNFPGASFHLLRRRCAQPVAVHRDFSRGGL